MDELQLLESKLNFWKNIQLWAPLAGLFILILFAARVDYIEKQIKKYGNSAEALIKVADELIGQMKEFMERSSRELSQMRNPISPEVSKLPASEVQKIWDSYGRMVSEHFLKADTEWNERFKIKAQDVRGKLQKLLPPEFNDSKMDFTYGYANQVHMYQQIIDDLERMNLYLKDHH